MNGHAMSYKVIKHLVFKKRYLEFSEVKQVFFT